MSRGFSWLQFYALLSGIHMIIEYFFDEAMFFVNSEIRKQDFNFPGVENIQDAVWHLFGRSFIYIIKQELYNRTYKRINF